ncbi:signal transduction histidine kinase [Flavobacterium arsenatis]|uniref:histidine kinase n=1 Tax=Flavobacterium arsenatis TaxID=1484332 RepID=A0ABU1TN30_9FLAO|nr:ATP-binding protein [Flavobacterium arsenatis]MDR6967363.1 signal transduction histidine kinase [Flavobacterium arsenatis]
MKFLKQNKYVFFLRIALGISIIAIGYLTTMFYFQMKDLDSSFQSIENSNATQNELDHLFSILKEDEIKLSNLIIAEDIAFSKGIFSREEALSKIDRLKQLSFVHRFLHESILQLEVLIDKKYTLFQEIVVLSRKSSASEETFTEKLYENKRFNVELYSFLENELRPIIRGIQLHDSNYPEKISDTRKTVFILAIVSILIFLLSYSKMNDNLLILKKVNDDLRLLNETFNNAEKIAGFGYWKVNLKTNNYTFSDNFYRLLEEEKQHFHPSFENIIKYIHPDDHEYVAKTYQNSIESHIPTSILYRYILPSGVLKYVILTANFRTNNKGESIKIGVIHDVTEQFKKTFELEENNKKLIAINAELESFNNIASHDLQEPLRKIQMFISRIEANDLEAISESGKGYFDKIKLSANRMQNLMIDLVNYSRTIKSDKVFIKINLNEILKDVIDELAVNVQETKAKISIDELPEIFGTKFQIQQLFVNLISNSLKYTKPSVIPEIQISWVDSFMDNLKEAVNDASDKIISDKDYYKIIVSDNGIGFNQEYSHRIFQLFRRLETEITYTGTGLGLAICKKIIENHNGYIKAEGTLNVGAKFIIYLPKTL